MTKEPTQSRGLRLPASAWESLEGEAAGLGMTLNEYLRRRLLSQVSRVRERENEQHVSNGHDDVASAFKGSLS
jgi:hypothetical protein